MSETVTIDASVVRQIKRSADPSEQQPNTAERLRRIKSEVEADHFGEMEIEARHLSSLASSCDHRNELTRIACREARAALEEVGYWG